MIIGNNQDAGKWAIILNKILVVYYFMWSLNYKVIFAAWYIIYDK